MSNLRTQEEKQHKIVKAMVGIAEDRYLSNDILFKVRAEEYILII